MDDAGKREEEDDDDDDDDVDWLDDAVCAGAVPRRRLLLELMGKDGRDDDAT